MTIMWSENGPKGLGPTKKPLIRRDFVTTDITKDVPFMKYMLGDLTSAEAGTTLSFEGQTPGDSWRVFVLEKGKKYRVQHFGIMTAAQASVQVDANAGFIWTIQDLKDKNAPLKSIVQVSQGAVGSSVTYHSIAGKVRIVRHADDAYSVFCGQGGETRIPPTQGMNLIETIPPEDNVLIWQQKHLKAHDVPFNIVQDCVSKLNKGSPKPTEYHAGSGTKVMIRALKDGVGFEITTDGHSQPLSREMPHNLGWNPPPTTVIEWAPIMIGDKSPISDSYVWTPEQLAEFGLTDLPASEPGNCSTRYMSRTFDRIDVFRLLSGKFSVYINGHSMEPSETDCCIAPLQPPVDPATLAMIGELMWTDAELKTSEVPPYVRHQLETTTEVYYSSDAQKAIIRIVKFAKDTFQVSIGKTERTPDSTLDLSRHVQSVALWGGMELIEGGVPPEILTVMEDSTEVTYLGKDAVYYTILKSEGGGYLVRRHRDRTLCYRHANDEIAASHAVVGELHKLATSQKDLQKGEKAVQLWKKAQLTKHGMPDFVFVECDMPDHGGVCTYISSKDQSVYQVTKVDQDHYVVLRNSEPVDYAAGDLTFVGHSEEEVQLDASWVWSHYVLTEANVPAHLVEAFKTSKIGAEQKYVSEFNQSVRIWKVAPDGYHVQVNGTNEKPNVKLQLGAITLKSKHDGIKIPLHMIPEGPDPGKIYFTLTDLRKAKVPSTVIKLALNLSHPGDFTTYLMKGGSPIQVELTEMPGRWLVTWNNKFLGRREILDLSGTLPRKPREPKELTPLQQRFANITSQLNTKRRRRNAKEPDHDGKA